MKEKRNETKTISTSQCRSGCWLSRL